MSLKEEADKQSQEFMKRLVKMSPMHKADKTLYEATRLNYVSGFMAGAKAQEEIDKTAMYDHDEMCGLIDKAIRPHLSYVHNSDSDTWINNFIEQNQKPLN